MMQKLRIRETGASVMRLAVSRLGLIKALLQS